MRILCAVARIALLLPLQAWMREKNAFKYPYLRRVFSARPAHPANANFLIHVTEKYFILHIPKHFNPAPIPSTTTTHANVFPGRALV